MKLRKIIMICTCIIVFTTYSHAFEIDIDENIDPMSLEMLVRQGILSEEERGRYIENQIAVLDENETIDKNIVNNDQEASSVDEFYVKAITVLTDTSIKITFNQEISDSSVIKNYYKIYNNEIEKYSYKDFSIRKTINDKSSVILKLSKEKFEYGDSYVLVLDKSIRSFYNVKVDLTKTKEIKFKAICKKNSNNVISTYSAYENGYIDVSFESEVDEKIISKLSNYKLSHNNGKIVNIAYKLLLIEDENGVMNTLRVYFPKFHDKYDYKFEISNLELENNIYNFPGGATYSDNLIINDISVIDNHTIKVELNKDIDYSKSRGIVKLIGKVDLDNFEVHDDTLILHLKKDGGMDFKKEYVIELYNFESLYGDKLNSVREVFLSGDMEEHSDYLDIEIKEAKWLGVNFIKMEFNKPVDIKSDIRGVMFIEDESGKRVTISEYYKVSPTEVILKTQRGSYKDRYSITCLSIHEKGSQFRSDRFTYTIK